MSSWRIPRSPFPNLESTSRLGEIVEQRPGENKRHQSSKHITHPQVSKRRIEVSFGITLRLEREDKQGHHSRA